MSVVGVTEGMQVAESGDPGDVNPHFLARVLALAQSRKVVASGDIVAANHARLILADTPLDSSNIALLREHRLARPLEDCLHISEPITSQRVAEAALSMIEQFDIVKLIDASSADASIPDVLAQLRLTPPLQAVLTVYCAQREDRLQHTVGVSVLTLALARRLLPGKALLQRQLALAGLMHDVGELYIAPIEAQRDVPLEAGQWRQIANHPVIGSRVLARMEGAGPMVAEAVLSHHERLDGFGYPRGISDADFALPTQLLAVAEWLMGLLEAGKEALMRASVAARLIPGEFSPQALEPVHQALRGTRELAEWLAAQQAEIASRVMPLSATLRRFEGVQQWIAGQGVSASPALRSVLLKAYRRMNRLQASFAGAGLDLCNPEYVMLGLEDPAAAQELGALLGEFDWRLREMERACLLRASMLNNSDMEVVKLMLARIRGEL